MRTISKTERAICDAYIELMDDLPFDRIRVKDIIERAGIGRSTFYDHFDSATAVLEAIEQEIYDTFPDGAQAAADTQAGESVREAAVRLACRHLQLNVAAYRALCGPNGDFAFQAHMARRNRRVMESIIASTPCTCSEAEKQVVTQAMAGVQWYTLKWWAAHADEISIAELSHMLYKIQNAVVAQLA